MKYNVFCDLHHAGLLQSLILLFERRFGGKVYRPIGMDWYTKGYWHVYNHPATVEQYLGIGGATPDNTPKLNEVVTRLGNYMYICHDIDSDETNRAITYDGFMAMPIDIVIASLPYHIEPFKKLCAEHPNKPKLIFQIGNNWTSEAGNAPNIMASAKVDTYPSDINFVQYLQEFDTNIFRPSPILQKKKITSLVNCFSTDGLFAEDFRLFERVERMMPDYTFKAYGAQGRDGCMHGAKQVAGAINDAQFVWHTKRGGDGYGHIIHNSAYMGKPMIVKKEYYAGKLGEKLMIDGKTVIAIDGLGPQQIINKIRFYENEIEYRRLCEGVYENAVSHINFDNEAQKIQVFLANLKP